MDINTQIKMVSENSLYSFYYTRELDNNNIVNLTNALKNNSTLVSFTLSFSYDIGENIFDIIESLSNNVHLERLDLAGNNLGDDVIIKICDMIKPHKNIKFINVTANMLGQSGIDALSQLLSKNKNIEEIVFGEEYLYDLNIYTFFNSLSNNINLRRLSIPLGNLNNNDLNSLASFIRKNKTYLTLDLRISQCNNIVETIAILLSENTIINSLTLIGSSDDDVDVICNSLKFNMNLTELQLISGNITNVGAFKLVELLSINTTIKQINLMNNCINAEGIILLCNNSSLEHLSVNCYENINELLLAQSLSDTLCKNTTLKYFCFQNPDIDENAWNNFIKSIQDNYTITDFGYHINLTDETVKFIERNKLNYSELRFGKVKAIHN